MEPICWEIPAKSAKSFEVMESVIQLNVVEQEVFNDDWVE